MRFRVIGMLAMALCLAVGSASASSIGVYFAADASDCDGNVAAGTQGTIYIVALLGGDGLAGGMTTAEFRVDGFPGGWFPSVTANPAANITLGGPLSGGCNIAFPVCQGGPRVLLYSINFFATSTVGETYLRVDRHTTPTNLAFPCPYMTDCTPNFVIFCVQGGQAILNGRPCTIGVEPTSWSKVKNLYQ